MLHIGKTGGSAVKHALKSVPPDERFTLHRQRHHVTLKDIPDGERFFFFLRDPIKRYISSFNSRLRRGMPRYFVRWRPGEKIAFKHFKTPNELALALSGDDRAQRHRAKNAMNRILHVKRSFWYWFVDEAYFMSRIDDLFFIGFQESLDSDFEILKTKLMLPEDLALTSDEIIVHKNPDHLDKHLDDETIENLKKWYAKDYEFMDLCREIIEEKGLNRSVPMIEEGVTP
jgi:hypothetical protein